MPEKQKRKDGRTLRGERSRAAVARGTLDLIKEGHIRPTAADVAARAGVSLRLVFHHFKDMDRLYEQAQRVFWDDVSEDLMTVVTPADDLPTRIKVFCKRRGSFYEALTPIRHASRYAAATSEKVAQGTDMLRRVKREQVSWLFGAELGKVSDRDARQALLMTMTSWAAWENMRQHQGLSQTLAEDTMALSIRIALQTESPST